MVPLIMANIDTAPITLSSMYPEYCYSDEVPFNVIFKRDLPMPQFLDFKQLASQALASHNNPFSNTRHSVLDIAYENVYNFTQGRVYEDVISGKYCNEILNLLTQRIEGDLMVGNSYTVEIELPSLSAYALRVGIGLEVIISDDTDINSGAGLIYPLVGLSGANIVSIPENGFSWVVKNNNNNEPITNINTHLYNRTDSTFNGELGRTILSNTETYSNPNIWAITNGSNNDLVVEFTFTLPESL